MGAATQLSAHWERLRSSFWFVPATMTLAAAGAAFGAIAADRVVGHHLEALGWFYAGGPEGARAVLSTVAGSVITVAGVTFSITIAVLSLASNQLGPRLPRTFVRDRGNQVVLGTFVATFVYCLLVLRTVRTGETFVPHASVTLAVLLALTSLGVLIWFIHHVAVGIQIDHVLAAVSDELHGALRRLFPEEVGRPARAEPAPTLPAARLEGEGPRVASTRTGYLQLVDGDGLLALATRHDLVLRIERHPGAFLAAGDPLVTAWPPAGARALEARLRGLFVVGVERTLRQDVAFGFHQLVEIGVRALSPGTNDPFTAASCVDHLAVALVERVRRATPPAHRLDAGGHLRVVAEPIGPEQLVPLVFDPLREYGRGSTLVTLRLLDALERVAREATEPPLLEALDEQVRALATPEPGRADRDQRQVTRRLHEVEATHEARLTEPLRARARRSAAGPTT